MLRGWWSCWSWDFVTLWNGEKKVYGSFEPRWVRGITCNLCFSVSRKILYSKTCFSKTSLAKAHSRVSLGKGLENTCLSDVWQSWAFLACMGSLDSCWDIAVIRPGGDTRVCSITKVLCHPRLWGRGASGSATAPHRTSFKPCSQMPVPTASPSLGLILGPPRGHGELAQGAEWLCTCWGTSCWKAAACARIHIYNCGDAVTRRCPELD